MRSRTTSAASRRRSRAPRSRRSSWRWRSRNGHEDPRPRQLRLVHLQPRPVPGGAGRGRRGRAQRPCDGGGAARARVQLRRRLAGAVHARRVRHLAGGGAGVPGGGDPHARRLPGAPGDGAGVRRARRPSPADPRQDRGDRARRPHDLRRAAVAADRRALPLARRGGGDAAGRARGLGARRRRDPGDPPSHAAGRGDPVPSRVGAHAARHGDPAQLPRRRHARGRRRDRVSAALLTRTIDALASGEDISEDDAAAVLAEIMVGNASEVQIAGFLIALRTKGETVEEITGLARTMRRLAAHVDVARDSELVDVVGTGGGRPTFNVSTTAALIAAGADCRIAKHGNRSATGLSGAADVLEALGARIDLEPAAVGRCIEEVGFGFMFAPTHHAATRYVIPVRKQLAVRTIFNVLGPLTNPAGVTRQLTGVADRRYLDPIAGAFEQLGATHVLVVSSDDGLDELSTVAPSAVVEVRDGALSRFVVDAAEVGLDSAQPDELNGGTPEVNAEIARRILAGERGAPRDVAVLNAGAGIYAGGRGGDRLRRHREGARRLRHVHPASHEGGIVSVNTLERIVDSTRREVQQR